MKIHEFNDLLNKISICTYIETKLKINTDPFNEETEQDQLNDNQVLALVSVIKKNPYITEIDLSGNKLTDVSAIALASIKPLKILNLAYNNITVKGAVALTATSITKLYLQNNNIISEDSTIIDALIHNKSIIELNIHSSCIPSEMIANLIKNNTNIKILYLGYDLTDKSLEFIGENKTLEKLVINMNEISDKGAEYLTSNTSLKTLILDQSNIGDIGAKILSQHNSLRVLTLRDSHITKIGSEYFFNSHFTKVTILNGISHNFMSSNEALEFNYKFKEYSQKKLKDQQEYYLNITGGKQYFGVHPDMNDFDSIQNAIEFLQTQWHLEYNEQSLMGNINE